MSSTELSYLNRSTSLMLRHYRTEREWFDIRLLRTCWTRNIWRKKLICGPLQMWRHGPSGKKKVFLYLSFHLTMYLVNKWLNYYEFPEPNTIWTLIIWIDPKSFCQSTKKKQQLLIFKKPESPSVIHFYLKS